MSDILKLIIVWLGIPICGMIISYLFGQLSCKIHRHNKEQNNDKKRL